MISIRKSFSEIEQREELERRAGLASTLLDCYAVAIHSSAHYAVEIDPAVAAEFRNHLKKIEEQSRAAASADEFHAVQSSFRGELREYRDKSAELLQKMRKEIESATAAMMIFADTVTSLGDDHEKQVGAELRSLEKQAESNNIDEIRCGIRAAIGEIETSLHQMQRGNQLVVAQLQDEIRMLHQQIESERKSLFTDRASGAWNRQKIDMHVENLIRQNQPFCLLIVWVRNLKFIEGQYSRTIVEGSLKALIARFAALTGEDAYIGRWTEDQFVAVLDLPLSSAIRLSVEATRKLSGGYSVQENGLAQTVVIQATAGIVERHSGTDSSKFREKLEQLAGSIAEA
jgi:GGDEF domain-containing protein